MNNANFVTARMLRRRIVKSFEDQQQNDSACSEKLRLIISRHTRNILSIIGDFLLRYGEREIAAHDRKLFSQIAPSWLPPELWVSALAEEKECAERLFRASALLQVAERDYKRLAPFGTLSGWFAEKNDESQINAAKRTRDDLRGQTQSATRQHEIKVSAIHGYAELLLRSAMTIAGISALLATPVVRDTLQPALDTFGTEVKELWVEHMRAQASSIDAVRSDISTLTATYTAECANTTALWMR